MDKRERAALPEIDKNNPFLLYANEMAPLLDGMTESEKSQTAIRTAQMRHELRGSDSGSNPGKLFVFVGKRVADTIREQIEKHAA